MMRLREIERGDRLSSRLLFKLISVISGTRFPDAARVAYYHRGFAGPVLNAWTQQVMRGPSEWSVGERELMAAMVARFNSCPFCVGAHGAVAIHGLGAEVVEAALGDYRSAPLSDVLRAALTFIEKMTRDPEELGVDDARAATMAGVGRNQLLDAAAVATVFNIVTRYANALDFEIPSPSDFAKSAKTLLKRGYK
ncbi:carboxymuconolactone decarboxylase family protein [Arthrobacter sp. 2RAF6]|uniref:carboxymuconolactone decarboxylase family protein n=1 Tax=Arthrobacter sp. 2RAF6 TaxID=3233002 RepID=UPI003F924494